MNVSLTPQLEAMVQAKVESGMYTSASEVVREALRLLDEYDRIRTMRLVELRRDIAAGLSDLEHDRAVTVDQSELDQLAAEIKAEGRERRRREGGRMPGGRQGAK